MIINDDLSVRSAEKMSQGRAKLKSTKRVSKLAKNTIVCSLARSIKLI